MGSFNLGNKSKSGGIISGLYGAWSNTSHSYLLSKSATTFMMIRRWPQAKIIFLTFDCDRRNFLGRGEVGLFHASSIATIRHKNAWLSKLNLCFSSFPITRLFCFCSAVRQWGTQRAQIFIFCKSFVKIRITEFGEIPLTCDISSYVARRFSAKTVRRKFHTSLICWCFRPSWHRIILYGDTSSTKTSCPTGKYTTVQCLLTTNFTQSTVNFCRVFAT